MNVVADIMMFAWPAVVLAIFLVATPRKAVIASFVLGWLFLPLSTYSLPLIPDYSKMTATSLSVAAAILLFDASRIHRLRPSWIDLPIAVFCVCPLFSSLTNDLGIWDGVSATVGQSLTWGLPYMVGRIYFDDGPAIRELAIGIFLGGLIYVPFCWFEMRMSPQLAQMVYGDSGRWGNAVRFGGYRPRVFMQDGLMVAMWMATATLIGICLWRAKLLPQLYNLPASLWVAMLTTTTILCRSTGALALLLVGLACFWFTRASLTRLALIGLLAIAPAYLFTRIAGFWDGTQITHLVAQLDEDRAQSFQFRLDNEDILVAKAMQSPILGWGGWGRSRVFDEFGKDISITDGLWIQILGTNGLIGLIALYGILLLPLWQCISFYRVMPSRDLPVILSLSIATTLYAIDCLPNSMENPTFMLIAGGLANASTFKRKLIDDREVVSTNTDARSRQPWPRCSQAT